MLKVAPQTIAIPRSLFKKFEPISKERYGNMALAIAHSVITYDHIQLNINTGTAIAPKIHAFNPQPTVEVRVVFRPQTRLFLQRARKDGHFASIDDLVTRSILMILSLWNSDKKRLDPLRTPDGEDISLSGGFGGQSQEEAIQLHNQNDPDTFLTI